MIAFKDGVSKVLKHYDFDSEIVNFLEGQLQLIKLQYDGENITLYLEDIDNMSRGY